MSRARKMERDERQLQLLCRIEGPQMEASRASADAACALGEDEDRAARLHPLPQARHTLLDAVGHGQEARLTDDIAEERTAPGPVFGHDDDVGREREDAHQVEDRQVVAHQHRRTR